MIREELCQGKYKLNKNNKNSRSYSNLNKAILKEQISERHARALLNVPDSNAQKELLKKVIDEKISVRKKILQVRSMPALIVDSIVENVI